MSSNLQIDVNSKKIANSFKEERKCNYQKASKIFKALEFTLFIVSFALFITTTYNASKYGSHFETVKSIISLIGFTEEISSLHFLLQTVRSISLNITDPNYDSTYTKNGSYLELQNYFRDKTPLNLTAYLTDDSYCSYKRETNFFNNYKGQYCEISNECTSEECESITYNISSDTMNAETFDEFEMIFYSSIFQLRDINLKLAVNNAYLSMAIFIDLYFTIKSSGLVVSSFEYTNMYLNELQNWIIIWVAYYVFNILYTLSVFITIMLAHKTDVNNSADKTCRHYAKLLFKDPWFYILIVLSSLIIFGLGYVSKLYDFSIKEPTIDEENAKIYFNLIDSINILAGLTGIIILLIANRYLSTLYSFFYKKAENNVITALGWRLLEFILILVITLLAFSYAAFFFYGFAALPLNNFSDAFISWFSILFGQTDSYDVMMDYNVTFAAVFFILFIFLDIFILLNIFTVMILHYLQKQEKIKYSGNHLFWYQHLKLMVNKKSKKDRAAEIAEHTKFCNKNLFEIKLSSSIQEDILTLKRIDPYITSAQKEEKKNNIKYRIGIQNLKSLCFLLIVIFSTSVLYSIYSNETPDTKLCISKRLKTNCNSSSIMFDDIQYQRNVSDWISYTLPSCFINYNDQYFIGSRNNILSNEVIIWFKRGKYNSSNGKFMLPKGDSYNVENLFLKDENEDISITDYKNTADQKINSFYYYLPSEPNKIAETMDQLNKEGYLREGLWCLSVALVTTDRLSENEVINTYIEISFAFLQPEAIHKEILIYPEYSLQNGHFLSSNKQIALILLFIVFMVNTGFLVYQIYMNYLHYQEWYHSKRFSDEVQYHRSLYYPETLRALQFCFSGGSILEIIYSTLLLIIIIAMLIFNSSYSIPSDTYNEDIIDYFIKENNVYYIRKYWFISYLVAFHYIIGFTGALQVLQRLSSFSIIIATIKTAFFEVLIQIITLVFIFMAYWGICNLCLSTYDDQFGGLIVTLIKLLEFSMGTFNPSELMKSSPAIGIMFLITLLFIVKMIIFNNILGVFTMSVKKEIENYKEPPNIIGFFSSICYLAKKKQKAKSSAVAAPQMSAAQNSSDDYGYGDVMKLDTTIKYIERRQLISELKAEGCKLNSIISSMSTNLKEHGKQYKKSKKIDETKYCAKFNSSLRVLTAITQLQHYQLMHTIEEIQRVEKNIKNNQKQAAENKEKATFTQQLIHKNNAHS